MHIGVKAGAEAEHRPHARDDRYSKGMMLGKRSEWRGGDGERDSEGGKKESIGLDFLSLLIQICLVKWIYLVS